MHCFPGNARVSFEGRACCQGLSHPVALLPDQGSRAPRRSRFSADRYRHYCATPARFGIWDPSPGAGKQRPGK